MDQNMCDCAPCYDCTLKICRSAKYAICIKCAHITIIVLILIVVAMSITIYFMHQVIDHECKGLGQILVKGVSSFISGRNEAEKQG